MCSTHVHGIHVLHEICMCVVHLYMEYTCSYSLRNGHADSGGLMLPQTRILELDSVGEFTFQGLPSRNPWCDLREKLFSFCSPTTRQSSEANARCREYSHTQDHTQGTLCKMCTEVRNQSARCSQIKVFNPIVLPTSSCEMTAGERSDMNDTIERKKCDEEDAARTNVTNNLKTICSIQESSGLTHATDTSCVITRNGKGYDQTEKDSVNTSSLFENNNQRDFGKNDDCMPSFSPFLNFSEDCDGLKEHGILNVNGRKGRDGLERAYQDLNSFQGSLNLLSPFVSPEHGADNDISDTELATQVSEVGNVYPNAHDKYLNFANKESSKKDCCNDKSSSNCQDDNNSRVDHCNTSVTGSGNESLYNYSVNTEGTGDCKWEDGDIDMKRISKQLTSCESEESFTKERKSNANHDTNEDQFLNTRNEKAKTAGRNYYKHDKQGVSTDPKLDSSSFSPTELYSETFSAPKSAFRRVNASVFYPVSTRLVSHLHVSQTGQSAFFPFNRERISDFPGFNLSNMSNLYQSNSIPNVQVSASNNRKELFDPQYRPLLSENNCWYNAFYPYSVEKVWQNNQPCPNSRIDANNFSFSQDDQIIRRLNEEIPVHTVLSKNKVMLYRCGLCGFTCSSGTQFKNHGRIHSGRDGKLFKCECGRAFARNEELTRHRRIHSDYKPHQCHVCKKAFGRKDHLGKHLVTHLDTSQKKVHKCTVCGCEQRYTRSDALARHQRAAHGINARSTKSGVQKQLGTCTSTF